MHYLKPPPPPTVPTALRWTLALCILANLLPIWTVRWLPMGDLGGHLELMDIVARYTDPHTLYRDIYLLPRSLDPNTLSLWFARLMPFGNVLFASRLLLSAYVIGLPLSMVALARSSRRSPWLALLSLPLTWNALVNCGLLNYMLALPLLLWSLALARRYAEVPGHKRGFLLAFVLILLFFCHVIAYLLGVAMVAYMIVWHREDNWGLVRLWVLIPGLPLILQWIFRKFIFLEATAEGRTFGTRQGLGLVVLPKSELAERIYAWAMQYFRDNTDEIAALILLAIWLLYLILGYWQITHEDRGLLDAETFERRMFGRRKWTPLTWLGFHPPLKERRSPLVSRPDRRRVRWVDVRLWLAKRDLEFLTIICAVMYFFLPTHMNEMSIITERLVVQVLLLLALWPRIEFVGWRRLLLVPLVLLNLGYAGVVRAEFRKFEQKEIGGLPEALQKLPDKSRFCYVIWDRDAETTFMGPLWHMPRAIFALQHGGLVDDSFAVRPYTPVQYRKGVIPTELDGQFWRNPHLYDYDWVLVRSLAKPHNIDAAENLRREWHEGYWWLYRVVPGDRARVHPLVTGGAGGTGEYFDCPRGSVLTGVDVQAKDGLLRSAVALCRDLPQRQPPAKSPEHGPRLGERAADAADEHLACPKDQYVVGISGRSALFVDAIQLQCAPLPWPDAQTHMVPTRTVGGEGGKNFLLHCPDGMVAVGVQGSFGEVADQLGLACADVHTW